MRRRHIKNFVINSNQISPNLAVYAPGLNLLPKCRQCGIVGNHKIDIFNENPR